MEKIDFVITWVDGSDPEWLAEKNRFEKNGFCETTSEEANSECRYRADKKLLRYWFRSVEKFAPWVNKIHFVSCGQKPEWLNEEHPKLNLVNHKDFIPEQYLPTFNSRPIELNLHRIDELSEHFVLFNDDVFLLQQLEPDFFFKEGNPALVTDLKYTRFVGYNNWSRVLFNDYCVLNEHFDMGKQIWLNRKKWFDVSALGLKRTRQNLMCYLANKSLPVGTNAHLSYPNLKSTLETLWEVENDVLDETCKCKFRSDNQVNVYLLSAWNQAMGKFFPVHEKNRGMFFQICPQDIENIVAVIKYKQFPQICLNDSPLNELVDESRKAIAEAFESNFPEKSSFEKQCIG